MDIFLIDLFSAIFFNFIEIIFCIIALVRSKYGKSFWGVYMSGLIIQGITIFGNFISLRRYPDNLGYYIMDSVIYVLVAFGFLYAMLPSVKEKKAADQKPSVASAVNPESETVYLFDDIDGNLVRVPESKLASWEEAQSEPHKPLTETEKPVRDRIVNDIFNSSSQPVFNEDTSIKPQSGNKSASKKKGFSKEWLVIASILLAVSLIVYSFVNEPVSIDDISPSTATTQSSVPNPSQYPVPVSNGQIFKIPEYVGVCPLNVSAKGTNSYFVYLKYIATSDNSKEDRTQRHDTLTIQRESITSLVASVPEEKFDDISFYVSSGSTANIEIPIGIYQLYYACGKTWYGVQDLFGDETTCYTADKLLNFFFDGDNYNGHTLELQSQNTGSFEAEAICKSDFPR